MIRSGYRSDIPKSGLVMPANPITLPRDAPRDRSPSPDQSRGPANLAACPAARYRRAVRRRTAGVAAAVEHLGYVQIDTIHVIERCHHHILYSRIPAYARADLRQAQSVDKSVFEYWTHALSYVPAKDFRFFVRQCGGTGARATDGSRPSSRRTCAR